MAWSNCLALVLLISPLSVFGGVFSTLVSPYTLTSSVEVLKTPVTKVETISVPTYTTKSYSSSDSSNAEIQSLLRSLLSEIRNSNIVKSNPITIRDSVTLGDSFGLKPPAPSDSYGAPPPPSESYGPPSESYGPPPKPSKVDKVVVVQEKQVTPVIAGPFASAIAIAGAPLAAKDYVRTVYQPVYVPYQYAAAAPTAELVSVAQPVSQTVAVPTSIKTGASAVAYSTIHSSPAYAIQQQQYASVPVVQQQLTTVPVVQQQVVQEQVQVVDGGYNKKK